MPQLELELCYNYTDVKRTRVIFIDHVLKLR